MRLTSPVRRRSGRRGIKALKAASRDGRSRRPAAAARRLLGRRARPAGPDRRCGFDDPDQRRRHHVAIVVPTIIAALAFAWCFRASNTKAQYLPELVLFRPDRAGGLVHSDPDHHVPRRRDLDRLSRARSRSGLCRPRTRRSRCRSSRSTGSGCSSTPMRASRASTSWWFRPACRCISPDLGQRHQRVLRARSSAA